MFWQLDGVKGFFLFPKREQTFLKVLVIGEVVVEGPFRHIKATGQRLDRERFGSCLFKQGEPFLEPSAFGEKRHDLFLLLPDTFLFLISYHTIWYVCKRRMLFSSYLLLCHVY